MQLDVKLADVERNLAACEELARDAARAGAELVSLPEFFTTGAAFVAELADRALAPDGAATQMLQRVAGDEGIHIGGSFLCRDSDGEVRNAYLLAGPDGRILGRHDKDLPTMWENALYVGGRDDGVIDADGFTAGAAVCWEFMRNATARRLRGRVDLVIGGSNWWTMPDWPPAPISARLEKANVRRSRDAPRMMARYVGAPVVHAANSGEFTCPMPELPFLSYRGRFQGGAFIADAEGRVLDHRDPAQGTGFAIANIEPQRIAPAEAIPDRYWMHGRGIAPAVAWNTQRLHGRRWYARNVRGHPPYEPAAAPEPAAPTTA